MAARLVVVQPTKLSFNPAMASVAAPQEIERRAELGERAKPDADKPPARRLDHTVAATANDLGLSVQVRDGFEPGVHSQL